MKTFILTCIFVLGLVGSTAAASRNLDAVEVTIGGAQTYTDVSLNTAAGSEYDLESEFLGGDSNWNWGGTANVLLGDRHQFRFATEFFDRSGGVTYNGNALGVDLDMATFSLGYMYWFNPEDTFSIGSGLGVAATATEFEASTNRVGVSNDEFTLYIPSLALEARYTPVDFMMLSSTASATTDFSGNNIYRLAAGVSVDVCQNFGLGSEFSWRHIDIDMVNENSLDLDVLAVSAYGKFRW